MLATSRYFVLTTDVFIPLGIVLAIFVALWALLFSSALSIKEVVCIADYKPCQNQNILAELAKAKGKNIFRFDDYALTTKLSKGDFMIKSIHITKKLPNTIVVNLLSVNPTIAFQPIDNRRLWVLCDDKGRVIDVKDTDPNVPTVLVNSLPPVQVGEKLDNKTYSDIQELVLAIQKSPIHYTAFVLLDDTSLALKLDTGQTALFTTTKSPLDQLAALHAIISDATIKKEYKTIDVRFSQAILRQN